MTPRDELDGLYGPCLEMAMRFLEKFGEFYPTAIALGIDAEMQAVAADIGEEHPDATELLAYLREALAAMAATGEIRASAVCVDVLTTVPGGGRTDAIKVELEHADAEPIDVLVPYRKIADGFEYDEAFAQQGTRHVFAPRAN